MMDTYKSEKIKYSMSARIHPTDKNVPDCMCILLLSDNHLFVIEDNYDGTYTDHYIIDLKYVDDIRISIEDKNEKKPAPGWAADLRKGRDSEIVKNRAPGRLHGFKRPKEYLEVVYKDNDFVIQHLYFDECDGNKKAFIKAAVGPGWSRGRFCGPL